MSDPTKPEKESPPEPHMEVETAPDSLPIEDTPERHPKRVHYRHIAAILVGFFVLIGILLVGFEQVYAGKVVPGVSAAGVYLGGLSRADAIKAVEQKVTEFKGAQLQIKYNGSVLQVPVSGLDYVYDTEQAINLAMDYGRQGSYLQRVKARLRAIMSRSTNVAVYSYNEVKLGQYLTTLQTEINTPVNNAALDFNGGKVSVRAGNEGKRVDGGLVILDFESRLAKTKTDPIVVTIYKLQPVVDQESLEAAKSQADTYLKGPIILRANGAKYTIDIPKIIAWINVTSSTSQRLMALPSLTDFAPHSKPGVKLTLNQRGIEDYVKVIAKRIDQKGQDASLTIRDGKATVFQPSRDGIALNKEGAVKSIIDALSSEIAERTLALEVKVTKPTVTEDSLNDLGIKELISEGTSTFPGSSAARIQNVTTASRRYNGLLIKPDETFSFGANLGEVGPQTGYAPAKVIVNNRQELQYGGGICQVSSTLYRAALLAGLPIVQRTNHSFAVSYYTAPYGVPGVDATIWYPSVDLKFKNDTGHYILIQTVLSGTSLKFQLYGTKTKEGRIRGPTFVSGSLDATKPSRTVFYRDVIVDGKVTKTDTTYTSYKASTDFPDSPQLH